ncbi:hypothetical protein G4B88_003409 [Cannabis sativa]|uniref:RNase H type-1 domain-containing protein n=1 Tax=Cannabis sativa TaxID=3483 RepID=A0A7J6H3S8_CANSA|nr:hypothetical protein G4B88_003409 [Cannabis sativa]
MDEIFGEVQSPRQDRLEKVKQKWVPPPDDYVTIKIDASLILDKMGCGLSAVIRGSEGDLIVAEIVFIPGVVSVNLAEAAAMHLGFRLAHRWSAPKAIVSSDCLGIVNDMQSSSSTFSDWGMLGREILALQQHFLSLKFTYVPRDCNAVANALAIWSHANDMDEKV